LTAGAICQNACQPVMRTWLATPPPAAAEEDLPTSGRVLPPGPGSISNAIGYGHSRRSRPVRQSRSRRRLVD